MDIEAKLEESGVETLENWELLALILRRGSTKCDVFTLSQKVQRLLSERNDHPELDELLDIDGVGVAKACQILACLELSQRFFLLKKGLQLTQPEQAIPLLGGLKQASQEEFWVLALDSQSRLINSKRLSKGLVNQTSVHPREAFRWAIEQNSVSVIFAHNHPSGDLTPSIQDINMTRRLLEVGELLGVQVNDHLIVSRWGWCSLRRETSCWSN